MNKYKKIAMAVVSTVMAGSMCFSLAACGGGTGNKKPDEGKNPGGNTPSIEVKDEYGILKDDKISLNYDVYQNRGTVTLNTAINHDGNPTAISFREGELGTQLKMPDGKTYSGGSVKAAWRAMGLDLNIEWNDVSNAQKTSANLSDLITRSKYATTDMFTSDLSEIVKYSSSVEILNLADYLDYMPNFNRFLNENPIVYLSLLGDGMSTDDGSGKKILVAPYFDGNDTIERYCIIRKDWADKLLNGNTELTGSTAWGKETYATSYMGSTNYKVDIVNENGVGTSQITKNYSAVASKIKESGHALNAAYLAASNNVAYSGSTGNILDIVNAAIAANNNVNGAQLINLLRAYIDVMYDGHYTADKRSNLFNGYDAAWDVDELTVMLRCVMLNASALGEEKVIAIAPRNVTHDRTPDLTKLAGQLYGVRGTESRYEYTYIDNQGNIKDSRNNKDFYEAHLKMHDLEQEGLIVGRADWADGWEGGVSSGKSNSSDKAKVFMLYDYSQTQTRNGFFAQDPDGVGKGKGFASTYNFAPIINPVSRWDVDGDGNHTDYMRFTESWRSTKTGGLGLNGALKNNPTKLAAAIQFVDYLYSKDGQITSTYGPMATNANSDGGFWYNEKATEAQIKAGEYFIYKGEKYSGTFFDGRYTPTITNKVYEHFTGKNIEGLTHLDAKEIPKACEKAARSFTDYARRLIGSTLPVGVKDQSFENQLTSKCGTNGASIVSTAIAAGVIKHVSLNIDTSNYWYTCVPTALPVPSQRQTALDGQTALKDFSGDAHGKKNFEDIFTHLIYSGLDSTYKRTEGLTAELTVTVPDTLEKLVTLISSGNTEGGYGALYRQQLQGTGWNQAKEYWEYLKPKAE